MGRRLAQNEGMVGAKRRRLVSFVGILGIPRHSFPLLLIFKLVLIGLDDLKSYTNIIYDKYYQNKFIFKILVF